MNAHVGDKLIIEGTHLGDHRRIGIITQITHRDGAPPYQVKWLEDGRTTLVFPGAESRIEPSVHPARPDDVAP